jgi:hypothetical protein
VDGFPRAGFQFGSATAFWAQFLSFFCGLLPLNLANRESLGQLLEERNKSATEAQQKHSPQHLLVGVQ